MSEKICLWNNSLKWLGCYAAVVEQMKDRKCLWEVYKRVNLNEVISREQTDFQFFFLLTLLHFNLAPYSMGIKTIRYFVMYSYLFLLYGKKKKKERKIVWKEKADQ